jgi:hypothetical protein
MLWTFHDGEREGKGVPRARDDARRRNDRTLEIAEWRDVCDRDRSREFRRVINATKAMATIDGRGLAKPDRAPRLAKVRSRPTNVSMSENGASCASTP